MNRVKKSKEKYKQLFGDGVPAEYVTDPDFQDILIHFIFGEVFHQGNLGDKERELITLVVLVTNQTLPQLKAHVHAALNVGLTSVEIREAVYQCAPYIGFPKTLNAIPEVNEVFKARNITLPVESQKRVEIIGLTRGFRCRSRFSGVSSRKIGSTLQPIKSTSKTIFRLSALAISTPVAVLI
ncbi:carboxymuconolactone decarboxylase family protein [Alicyclobacillus fastidiosus]|uniref:Carboxymuconolactone decarboxylase family protein n=1 Tax=Alicyclobacillus fastidiosus TaxID=392011 RepID=A0ABY6ZFA1_9BACL|nr:carboxymuconolactone decarboxylase family protein [Alicyclobacillus fastidiosus]WAH41410.1 carboxymuconolactone decarboxylase family protein [Alicyclobacillus fastidiosus]